MINITEGIEKSEAVGKASKNNFKIIECILIL